MAKFLKNTLPDVFRLLLGGCLPWACVIGFNLMVWLACILSGGVMAWGFWPDETWAVTKYWGAVIGVLWAYRLLFQADKQTQTAN